jgi:hypothetical protein
MATVSTNPLVNGLSGMLGRTIVFKNLHGKTIMASCPRPPTKQSEQQKINRTKFKQASFWAKGVLKDPLKKEYYQRKAKKLKLPNAYTAAITDYMRNPRLNQTNHSAAGVTYQVDKKDFEVTKVEVMIDNADGGIKETRLITKTNERHSEWSFTVSKEEWTSGFRVYVTDAAGQRTRWKLGGPQASDYSR